MLGKVAFYTLLRATSSACEPVATLTCMAGKIPPGGAQPVKKTIKYVAVECSLIK